MIFSKANFETLSTSLGIQACGAATGILTARFLGPVARGELATVILWPVIFSNMGLMGCNWVLAREVARNPVGECDWVAAAIAVGLCVAPVYFFAGYFLIPLLLPQDKGYLLPIARLCLSLIPLDIFNQLLLAVEHGRMRWRRYNLLRLSFFLFYLALIGFIGATHRTQVRWFVSAFLVSHLLTLAVRLWIQRNSLVAGKGRMQECRHLLRAGVPYFGATITNLVSLQVDTILVVSLLSTKAAGIYVVAAAFANGQSSIGDALGITSFAVLSNEKSAIQQGRIIAGTFRQSALASCGAGLALAGLIPFLVVPLFGSQFSGARWPAVILALAAAITASTNVLNQGLRGAGRPQAGVLSQLLGIAVMAVAALVFLRGLGLVGVAFAVLLSAGAQALVLVVGAAKWFRVSPLEFWPFGVSNMRSFFQLVSDVCLRYSRSPA